MRRTNDEFGYLPEEEHSPRETVSTPAEYAHPGQEYTGPADEYSMHPIAAPAEDKEGAQRILSDRRKKRSLLTMLAASSAAFILAFASPQEETVEISNYAFETAGEAVLLDKHTVQLVADKPQTWGAVWSVEPIDLQETSYITFDYFLTNFPDFAFGMGADGFTLAFAEEPTVNPLPGGDLGYRGTAAVEFDLCGNPQDEGEGFDDGEAAGEHVAIIGSRTGIHYQTAAAVTPMVDGQWHRAAVYVDAGSIEVSIDGSPTVSAVVEDLNKPLYMGFTGANGDGTCYDVIADARIDDRLIVFTGREAEASEIREMAGPMTKHEDYAARGKIPANATQFTMDFEVKSPGWEAEEEVLPPDLEVKTMDYWADCPECEEGRITCTNCKGAKTFFHDSPICGTCGGSGQVIKSYSQAEYRCGACGVVVAFPFPDCPSCGVEGAIMAYTPPPTYGPCGTCGGSGKTGNAWNETCGTCSGKGTLKCKNCKGEGRIFIKADEQ